MNKNDHHDIKPPKKLMTKSLKVWMKDMKLVDAVEETMDEVKWAVMVLV